MKLLELMLPELILVATACGLLLLGISTRRGARRAAPIIALAALVAVFIILFLELGDQHGTDIWGTFRIGSMALYIKLLTAGVGAILVLLAWPTNPAVTGSRSLELGGEVGEFFGLMLLSLTGVFLAAGANNAILLFLGLELASIPTYIMVSMSRPLPVAQEAGVKYFFLGAMSAAIMLFGFSYLYGVTGQTNLDQIAAYFQAQPLNEHGRPVWTAWPMLAVVMLIAGFAFKIAAVPLHAYAGDVYQGAATPVTAFLAFTPKAAGFIALIKILGVVGGTAWAVPEQATRLLWVIAVLTMTVGNVLGLLQANVKRVLAYSSVAHTGYMLVGLTALVAVPGNIDVQRAALQGVLFYLAAYGIMNAGAFGVLMLLPSRTLEPGAVGRRHGDPGQPLPATSAETFEDLAGQGRRHVALGLAMAVACFSLIGLPLTVGFFGKFYIFVPALRAELYWLVVLTAVNAAIGAAYYLRIVATLFLRTDPATDEAIATDIAESPNLARPLAGGFPIVMAVGLSVALTLGFGIVLPATERLSNRAHEAATAEITPPAPTASVSPALEQP